MLLSRRTHTSKASIMTLFFVSYFAFSCLLSIMKLSTGAQPVTVNSFSTAKYEHDKEASAAAASAATRDQAEQSFHQFINSQPSGSTVIGVIKPDASPLEQLRLREKIASTISSMQEMEREQTQTRKPPYETTGAAGADCFIEVTKVEKIAGKCNKVSSGVPICQADNYMTISNECS